MPATAPSRSWREFWNRPNRIYVNERHLAAHYRATADAILALRPGSGDRILDYGCGEALDAARVADGVGHLYLHDSAETVCARLAERFAPNSRITVLRPADLGAIAPGSLNLIVVNSVLQYLARAEAEALLGRARQWLDDGGRLVLADIVRPDVGAIEDAAALLAFARRHGFLLAALGGLAATAVGEYRRLRQDQPLATYTEADLVGLARSAGLATERLPRNLGFNQRRMTFVLRPRAG